ncbi:hypothetical protein [Vibrio coralliilyticus]|uniref:Conjugal transfer protein TraW n=1 Tax=Vibrio coralliilyticus TaxID=190893 RepID=A0AAP6ZPZ4_9VIBR|nr:hypothetical protein [Vibrio coralliilyticus]NOI31843.1 hypothetical protein [Vibrio coralliilyticus]NOJ25287.1 hypothetical protein [Vibrio coralliilyticus]
MVKAWPLTLLILCISNAALANGDFASNIARSKQDAIAAGQAALDTGFIDGLIGMNQDISSRSMPMPEQVREEKPLAPKHGQMYYVLITDAMGDDELKILFNSLAHRKDVVFVVRGLLPTEKTITDVGVRIIKLVRDLPQTPNVALDPRPFQEVNAEFAPQILMYNDGELAVSAQGLANPNYLLDKFNVGERGDLGNFGSVVKITERDITEVLKERFMKLDKEQLVADAKDRYWDRVEFLNMPTATESTLREFTPELIIEQDIVTPDGKVIALAGQTYNTLKLMPFTLRLVVFDATNPQQLEFVKTLPSTHLRTKFITTKFDRTLKWDAVKYVESQLNAPVYQLQSEIMNAFDIRVVPSVVTADNQRKVFLISEHQLSD